MTKVKVRKAQLRKIEKHIGSEKPKDVQRFVESALAAALAGTPPKAKGATKSAKPSKPAKKAAKRSSRKAAVKAQPAKPATHARTTPEPPVTPATAPAS